MKVIGVTGGMASGKSTVARMFARHGIRHVDADKLVHFLMVEDADTIAAIGDAFPQAVVEGSIQRSILADTISQHPEKLKTLETILHPRVRAMEVEAIAEARREEAPAIILDIPLLFESDAHLLCDVVVAVSAPVEHRRTRAFTRAGMTEEKWQKLLARQLTDDDRNARADVVIHTTTSEADTQATVDRLLQEWGI